MARMRRSADELGWAERYRIYAIMMLASFAYNFSFIIIDYIRPFLVSDAIMTLKQTALLYTAQSVGVLFGSFLVPPVVTRIGARWGLMGATALLTFGTLLHLAAAGFATWFAARLFVGFTLAGCYITSLTILANLAAPHIRARLLSINMAMFGIAQISYGLLGASFGGAWREMLVVAAVLPAIVAALTLALVPDDRLIDGYASTDEVAIASVVRGRWVEMLRGRLLWNTIGCILLAGIFFSAYAFYTGFITTYLLTVRKLPPTIIGLFYVVDGVGGLAGTVLHGWLADRYGRRRLFWAFFVGAAAVSCFLIAPTYIPLLVVIELFYALSVSSSAVWAAYFIELFPIRLRPMATSLFHGGHLVSLFAPLAVAAVAAHFPLAFGMALAPLTLLAAAFIWSRLPETLKTASDYRGFDAEKEGLPPRGTADFAAAGS